MVYPNGSSPIFGTPQVQPGMLGLNPASRRQQQTQGIGDLLTSLGIGLMGQGPSTTPQSPLQGLSQGLAMNGQMQQQRQAQQSNDLRDQIAQGQYGMEQQKFSADQQFQQARQDQLEKLIQGLPADQQTAARADPDTFFKAYAEHLFQKTGEFKPNIQTIQKGGNKESGYFDQNNNWVSLGSGPAWDPNGNQGNAYFGTPVPMIGPDGKAAVGMLGKDGKLHVAAADAGYTPAPGVTYVDTGTAQVPVPKNAGVTLPAGTGPLPIDVSGKAAQHATGTTEGTAQGTAAATLPAVEDSGNNALAQIEAIKSDPDLGWASGWTGLVLDHVPATKSKALTLKIDQLKNGAFLQAYSTLRGAGAITEVEGAKATAALARLDLSQSKDDFKQALEDYASVIRQGMARLKKASTGDFSPAGPQAPNQVPPAASGEDLYSKYGLTPPGAP